MSRTPKDIETLYQRIRAKKKKEGKSYTKVDFLRDIGITRKGTYSEWQRREYEPGLQSEMLMDVLEKRELG